MSLYFTSIALLCWSSIISALPQTLRPRSDNGLALTPPMGWNSYNHYSCSPNESIIMSNARALVNFGLKDLGYHYVETDCGWSVPYRLQNGSITWNASLFPSGFPAMGDSIHNLGLRFGVYSDSGVQMCMTGGVNQTGSLFHEAGDAQTFADWNADLLKYDNCYSDAALGYPDAEYYPAQSPAPRFKTMQDALNATGRSIVYAICEWGVDFPSAWAPATGNTWRVTNDIIPVWRTIPRILNQVVPQTSYAGPGHWLDLDMLEVGNNVFTKAEEQTHFSMWSIIKSPLIIGGRLNDTLGSIKKTSLATLQNADVISYNQDYLGVAASFRRRWTEDQFEVWVGPLSKKRTVAAVINWAGTDRTLTLDLPDMGLQSAGLIKNVWRNETTRGVLTSYTAKVVAHGTMLLELRDTTPAGMYSVSNYARVESNTTTFLHVYGLTTSSNYTLLISLSSPVIVDTTISVTSSASSHTITTQMFQSSETVSMTIALKAISNNIITISSTTHISISSISIKPPTGIYYPSTSFKLHGSTNLTICAPNTCTPVGSVIANLSSNSTTSISVHNPSSSGAKYVALDYTNNDVAIATSWTNGTNTRNLTITVNGQKAQRMELPLTGRTSELYSVGRGWYDTSSFGVLVDGWVNGTNEVVLGNAGGEGDVQPLAAWVVGMRVLW